MANEMRDRLVELSAEKVTHICRAKDEASRYYLEKIYGDCLEKAGLYIPNQGYAIIDKNAEIKIGDLVHCSKVSGQIGGYIKQVKELGEKVIVGTNYLDESRNFYFEAAEIFGVVKEVYCQFSRKRVFVRDQAEQKLKEMRGE